MPSKNDLSSFKVKPKNTLPKSTINDGNKEVARAGRKPKPIAEKESETVVLKLTQQELANLKHRAGLVPMGTFIKHHLRHETDLLSHIE